jgi:hypothetical protein
VVESGVRWSDSTTPSQSEAEGWQPLDPEGWRCSSCSDDGYSEESDDTYASGEDTAGGAGREEENDDEELEAADYEAASVARRAWASSA